MRVWDQSTDSAVMVLRGHTHTVSSVAFSRDGRRVVSGSLDKTVRVWHTSTGNTLMVLNGHTDSVRSVGFSHNGRRIVSGSSDESVRIWDAATGDALKIFDGHDGSVKSVAFSTSGSRIVSGSSDKTIRVWDESFALRYRREHTDREYTGWIISPSREERLMFVPLDESLPDSYNIITIPPSACSSIDFSHARLGTHWVDCYLPS